MLVIKHHSYYPRYKPKYHWRSVDVHFQDVAGHDSMLVLHIKAANTSKSTVQCHGQYFQISSGMWEYNHECNTRNAEPEIETDAYRPSRCSPQADGYGFMFGPPWVSGSGFWLRLELNRYVFAVQIRTTGGLPGRIDNTKLPTLDVMRWNDH
jgi:hypothetical protein